MDKKPKKVFIISLDGATFDVLKPLVKRGFLPNIKQLMQSGSHTDLESTIPPITPVAWTSFMTGKLPENHKVFGFMKYLPESRRTEFVSSYSISGKTIWQILSEKGKKVIVIHLPMTYPPAEVNGYMVSGFDTPSLNNDFTYPKNFKEEILKEIPDYGFTLAKGNEYFFEEDYDEFIVKIKRSLEQRFLVAELLLKRESWDVFMLQFQDLDRIQHNIWNYIDTDDDTLNEERKAKVYECYSYLDQLVGKLQERVKGIPHYKIVVSDHGFGDAMMTIHPNSILKEWGLLHVKPKKEQQKINRYRRWLHIIKNPLKELLHNTDDVQKMGRINYSPRDVNWTKTKAYVPIADFGGALCYVNRKGREPGGIITDNEYDALCEELKERFLNIKEPFMGEKAFTEVLVGKDYFNSNDSALPDLILVPNDRLTMERQYAINGIYSESSVPGTHRINGVLIAGGDNIKEGFSDFKANIIDMAPTILYMLDIPIPSDMDGKPVLDIFVDKNKDVKWDQAGSDSQNKKSDGQAYTESEKELMEDKLKNLGYL